MKKFKELSIGLMCLFIGIVFLCGALEILTIIDKIEQRSLQQARVEEAGHIPQENGVTVTHGSLTITRALKRVLQ